MTEAWDESEVADLQDDYQLLGELGRGASAVVYRARDRALGRLVAIKVVRAHSIASADDAMLRLAREARTVAKLHHPNIVTVHAVRRLRAGGLALVMQLIPGRTLKAAIVEQGPFPPAEAQRVMRDVAEALAYAHAHGVVHRDVKPENIFLDADTGRAMLSDFGIAHSNDNESRLTMTGAAIGTPAYMAPEQIDGAPADARSDLYSLGLVTWEMLTGRRPWDGESLYNVISKQKNEQLPAIDSLRPGVVPPQLQYIVERMLQKRAAARWGGAEGLITNLDHWVVPSDWGQWEAAHRRRREAERAAKSEAKAASRQRSEQAARTEQATVRFQRPVSGSRRGDTARTELGAQLVPSAATTASAAATPAGLEDSAPSWVREEEAAATGSGRRYAMVAALCAVMVIGSGGAWYAMRGGDARDASSERSIANQLGPAASAGAVALGDSNAGALVTDTMVGMIDDMPAGGALDSSAVNVTTRGGMAQRGELSVGSPGTDREASTAVPVVPDPRALADNSVPRPPRSSAPRARVDSPVTSASTAPSVRATDDNGVISAGGRHSCVVTDGRAFCWGANDRGQLGDGEVESREHPASVVGEIAFQQISAGLSHSCAVTRSGEAYCWGSDERGQLGDATTTSRSAPVRVNTNLTFRLVRTGSNHSCALTTSGEVACWGANNTGQLGDGSGSMRTSPVRVSVDRRFISLSAGWNHSCAIDGDGSAWCWGSNADGQLGDGTRANNTAPTRVVSTERFTSISAGGNHSCAITESGDAFCWGRNAYGQLGISGTASQSTPTRVQSNTRFTSVSVGGVHSCARTASGQAWCWGRNTYGQLGDGSNANRDVPVRVIGGGAFAAISATGAHTCGTTTDGAVSCWGFNVQGQLGDGTRNHLSRPTRVVMPGR